MLAKAKEAAAARVAKTKEAVKDVQTQLQVVLDNGKSPAQQAEDSSKSPAQRADESGKSPMPQGGGQCKSLKRRRWRKVRRRRALWAMSLFRRSRRLLVLQRPAH